ncbi:MAG: recombination protein O N-terminal domain-containing protein [Victivallaceae bacterium]|nr:recombination protein O N-terminal domain-containing protein [Victivallaceae bacterium]
MADSLETADVLILRKMPYRESSLILGALSAEFGKLELIAKGARKLSKKQFPAFDLFREVQVSFINTGKGGLHTVTGAELIRSNDALANIPDNFATAVKIAEFILNNSAPDLPSPLVYEALRHVMLNWALQGEGRDFPWSSRQCSVIVKTSYLYENGLLPEIPEPESRAAHNQQRIIERIIECGNEGAPLPVLDEVWWEQLNQWLNRLIKQHQLKY